MRPAATSWGVSKMWSGGKSRSSASRSSMYAMAELVVPRSMPIFIHLPAYVRVPPPFLPLVEIFWYRHPSQIRADPCIHDDCPKIIVGRTPWSAGDPPVAHPALDHRYSQAALTSPARTGFSSI